MKKVLEFFTEKDQNLLNNYIVNPPNPNNKLMETYKKYLKEVTEIKEAYESGDILGSQPHIEEMFSNPDELIILAEEEFNNKNDEFKNRWNKQKNLTRLLMRRIGIT